MARRFPSMRKVTTQKPSRIEAFRQSVAAIVNSSLFEFVAGILILLRPGCGESCFPLPMERLLGDAVKGKRLLQGAMPTSCPPPEDVGSLPVGISWYTVTVAAQ